jgi:glutamine synthetase
MIRIPSKRGKSTRVEVRNPDPSANPYLTLAVLLKAGLDGIKKNMDVPQERKLNLYELSQEEKDALGIDSLPADLEKALAALAENEIIKEALGKHAYTHYVQGKEEEWKDYILRVTEWEKERYLGL